MEDPQWDVKNRHEIFEQIDDMIYEYEKNRLKAVLGTHEKDSEGKVVEPTPIDAELKSKPPDVEYFFVGPFATFSIFRVGFGWNPYGQ